MNLSFLRRLLLLLGLGSATLPAAEVAKLTAPEAARLVATGQAVLVDVREPGECAETGVAAPAVLLPKSDFDGDQKLWKDFLAKTDGKQIILYCGSGRRAGVIGKTLAEQGRPVANAGGLKDWTAANLPVRPAAEPAK
jgi:rhodanese-related sulfurtransferase